MLVIDFYNMWWLLKELFLATRSAMSSQLRRSRARWLLKEPFQNFVAAPCDSITAGIALYSK